MPLEPVGNRTAIVPPSKNERGMREKARYSGLSEDLAQVGNFTSRVANFIDLSEISTNPIVKNEGEEEAPLA